MPNEFEKEKGSLLQMLARFGISRAILSSADVDQELKNPHSVFTVKTFLGIASRIIYVNMLLSICIMLYQIMTKLQALAREEGRHGASSYQAVSLAHAHGHFFNAIREKNLPFSEMFKEFFKKLDQQMLTLLTLRDELIQLWIEYPKRMTQLFNQYENQALEKLRLAAEKDPNLKEYYEEAKKNSEENAKRRENLPKILKDADIDIETSQDDIIRETGKRKALLGRELTLKNLYNTLKEKGIVSDEEVTALYLDIKNKVKECEDQIKQVKAKVTDAENNINASLAELSSKDVSLEEKLDNYIKMAATQGDHHLEDKVLSEVKIICQNVDDTWKDDSLSAQDKKEIIADNFQQLLAAFEKENIPSHLYLLHQTYLNEVINTLAPPSLNLNVNP